MYLSIIPTILLVALNIMEKLNTCQQLNVAPDYFDNPIKARNEMSS